MVTIIKFSAYFNRAISGKRGIKFKPINKSINYLKDSQIFGSHHMLIFSQLLEPTSNLSGGKKRCRVSTNQQKTKSILNIWISLVDQNNIDIFVFFNFGFQVWALKLYKHFSRDNDNPFTCSWLLYSQVRTTGKATFKISSH